MRRSPQGALLKGVSTCEKKLEAKSMERENYHKIKSILRRRVPKKAVNTKEPFKSSKGLKTGTGTWRESKVDKHSRRMKNSIHRHRIVIYRSNISLAWFHKYVFFPFFPVLYCCTFLRISAWWKLIFFLSRMVSLFLSVSVFLAYPGLMVRFRKSNNQFQSLVIVICQMKSKHQK